MSDPSAMEMKRFLISVAKQNQLARMTPNERREHTERIELRKELRKMIMENSIRKHPILSKKNIEEIQAVIQRLRSVPLKTRKRANSGEHKSPESRSRSRSRSRGGNKFPPFI